MLSEKKAVAEDHILYEDSIFFADMSKQGNLKRQKVD